MLHSTTTVASMLWLLSSLILFLTLVVSLLGSSNYLSGNKRFWHKNIKSSSPLQVEDVQSFLDSSVDKADRIESGIIFFDEVAVPIIESKAQPQHATKMIRRSKDEIDILAFFPRASHVTISPDAEERPVIDDRVKALNIALSLLTSTTSDELMSERFAGTSASRIYRSFVCPRSNKKRMLETVERAANRTANQIELSLRQIRADEASYLRNIDKSVLEIKGGSKRLDEADIKLNPVVIVCDNLRSAFNVGSIFRSADAAGVQSVMTTGITCHGSNPKLRKTAFSSIDTVPTQHFTDVMDCINELKNSGYTIVAMETTSKSQVYTDIKYPIKVAIIAGNEISGVDTRVMESADMIVEIPTYGAKNSLNVCSATSIILMEILRQYRTQKYI